MRVIPPLAITEAMLTSSTAAEPGVGEAAYNSGTAYAVGDLAILGSPSSTVTITIASPGVVTWAANGLPNGTPVVLTTSGALPTGLTAGTRYFVVNRAAGAFQLSATLDGAPIVTTGSQSGVHTATAQVHRIYESQTAANTGNPPAVSPTNWIEVGPTNRWAALDLLRNTATKAASPLTIVVTPGQRVDAIGLVGMVADSVTVSVSSGGPTVYTATQDLRTRPTATWFDYFFGRFSFQAAIALFDLPPYTNMVITVTLTRATGDAELGGLVIGQQVFLGTTQYSPVSEMINFSKIERDEFGNSLVVPRRNIPKVTARTWAPKGIVNKLLAVRSMLDAEPALWSGLDDAADGYFEALLILGLCKKFDIDLAHPDRAVTTMDLEEV